VDFKDYLAAKRDLVEDKMKAIFAHLPPSSGVLKEAMEYSLFSEGKRIRPVLAIAACEAMGGSIDNILPFAASIEMIHTYSLIHDDLPCMDNDDLRRGRPTCHKVFGEAIALLAGDGLLTEAFRVMSDPHNSPLSRSITGKIIFEIASASGACGMVAGQAMDVVYEGKKGSKKILNFIHKSKTSALIRASVVTGALAGHANSRQIRAFRTYGESIGLAFQIRDDLLDAEGDEAEVGKKLKKDDAKQTFVKHYGIAASKKRMAALVDKAVSSVVFLGPKSDMLNQIASFIGQRTS
jgi:geranylgeranyl diphosphate synthase, type II